MTRTRRIEHVRLMPGNVRPGAAEKGARQGFSVPGNRVRMRTGESHLSLREAADLAVAFDPKTRSVLIEYLGGNYFARGSTRKDVTLSPPGDPENAGTFFRALPLRTTAWLAPPGGYVLDKIQVVGDVPSFAVNGHTATSREHHMDALSLQMGADEGRQFSHGHCLNLLHSGFPFLRGRRRTITSRSRSFSG